MSDSDFRNPGDCPCNCTSIRDVSLSDRDLLDAVYFLGAVRLTKAPERSRTLIQTDRYQRRELIRNGISYKEIN